MRPPLVSIIIPIYNAEKYLDATVQSAFNQTWKNIEILLVDDGSTDNSLTIAKKYECTSIKVYVQNRNGAASARNKGISKANGEFLQFLDADDLLAPDKISRQLSLIGERKDTLGICPVIHFNDRQEHDLAALSPNDYELNFYGDSNNPYNFLLNLYGVNRTGGSMIPVHSWLTPIAVIKKAGLWDKSLTMNDDGEFFCRVALNAVSIVNSNDTFCYYRKIDLGESLSSNKNIQAYTSQLESILLIRNHLETHSQDYRINLVMARMLKELLVQVYPQHKQLAADIDRKLSEVGGSNHQPIIGGKVIELIKNVVGWKCARLFQYYYQKGKP